MPIFVYEFYQLDKDSQKTRFGICLNFFRPCPLYGETYMNNEFKTDQISNSVHHRTTEIFQTSDDNKQSILTSVCLISHHPFFSKFRQCLYSLKNIIDRCDEYFKKLYFSENKFYSFWSTFLNDGSSVRESIDESQSQVVYEIESWIIRLLNAPVPIPGKTCLHLSIGPESFYEKLIFALPDKTRLSLIDFPLHLPLELLGMETCLKVLSAIMLEQKVVLQSRDYNALTMSVMAFTAMLYPLQYMFPAIPLLPNTLEGGENLLLSPTPYIIGIPASFLGEKNEFRFPPDVWLVDLDTNKMMGSSLLESIPELPEKEGQELRENLNQALASMRMNQPSVDVSSEIESNTLSNPLNNVDSVDVATRVAMVRFFNSLNVLGNITEHTRTIRLFPRPVVAFQTFSFLKSRQVLTPFTRKLAQTQAVEFFAEWCLYPENEVFQRIHAGIHDPEQIGDKAIWYQHNLAQITFQIWSSEQTDQYRALNFIHSINMNDENVNNYQMIHRQFPKPADDSISDLNTLYNPPKSMEDLLKNAIQLQRIVRENKPKQRPDDQISQTDSFDSSGFKQKQQQQLQNQQYSTDNEDSSQLEMHEKRKLPGPMYTLPSMAESSSDSSDDQDDSDIWDLKTSTDNIKINEELDTTDPTYTTSSKDNSINETIKQNCVENTNSEHLSPNNTSNTVIIRKPSLRKTSNKQELNSSHEGNKRSVHYKEEPLEIMINRSESNESKGPEDVGEVQEGNVRNHVTEDVDGDNEDDDYDDDDDMEQTSVGKYLFNNLSDNLADAASHASTTLSGLLNKQKKIVSKSGNIMKKMATEIKSSVKHDVLNDTDKSTEMNHRKSDVDLIQSASKFVLNLPKKQIFHFGTGKFKQSDEQSGLNRENNHTNENRINSKEGVNSNLVNLQKSYADQEFLRDLVQCIHERQTGITTKFPVNRLKELLNDENYRNYLMSKLNRGLLKAFENPDECIPDVPIVSMDEYKTYIWLIQCMIRGLEQTCTNHGIGGLASAMMLLELCHTHYLDMSNSTVSPNKLQKSQNSTSEPQRDDENLVSALTGWLRTTTKDLKKVAKPNMVTGLFGRSTQSENVTSHNHTSTDSLRKEPQQLQQINTSGTSEPNTPDHLNVINKVRRKKCKHASAYRFTNGALIDPNLENQSIEAGGGSGDSVALNESTPTPTATADKINTTEQCYNRLYLYESLINENERSRLWDHKQFWEDTFFDTVAQERDILGMDQSPMEMIEQFAVMNPTQKRILLLKEDRLLALCLYNLIAYMILMRVNKGVLVNHVRRLLARCRIGSYFASIVSHLLDNLKYLEGNSIDLLPSLTRLKVFHSYEIQAINPPCKETRIMEIYGKCLIIRNLMGEVVKKLNNDQITDLSLDDSTVSLTFIENTDYREASSFQFHCDKAKQICHALQSLIQKTTTTENLP
ncbi:unnamed protein product [Trichobilharzia szidati]|nr:unnamed protein product [Trichobilharzia szidati]CAH8846358.1 unnamed protein product [Trichobilharzia szidati]